MRRRTYGTVAYHEATDRWYIRAEPHVRIVLGRVFPAIDIAESVGYLRATSTNTADLEWVMMRWPLEVRAKDRGRWESLLDQHRERQAVVDELAASGYVPAEFALAEPLRDYQRVGADHAVRRRRLLLGDQLGLGKTWTAMGMISDARARPALVVTMAHLTRQWLREAERLLPGARCHVLRTGSRKYSLDDLDEEGRLPDVTIANYHKLDGWAEYLTGKMRAVVYDECQEIRIAGTAKYDAAKAIADAAQFVLGMSVSAQSRVELRGDRFGSGWCGTIEQAWGLLGDVATDVMGGHEVLIMPMGVESRGWIDDAQGFGWKPVAKMIRHRNIRPLLRLTSGGRSVEMTSDHSAFVMTNAGPRDRRADRVDVGDVMPVDNGAGWGGDTETPVAAVDVAAAVEGAQVVVDMHGIDRHAIGATAWQWQNFHREARYGARVPLDVFVRHRDKLRAIGPVYVGRGRAAALPVEVMLSRWAYVLGFFIGDGWVSGGRVSFAVDNPRVRAFVDALVAMGIGLRPTVRRMLGRSSEVRVNHVLLAQLMRRLLGSAKCFDKRIPHEWIFTWSAAARADLLRGLIDSDGHIETGARGRRRHSYVTTSEALARDVEVLVRSLGGCAGLYRRQPMDGGVVQGRRIVGRRPSFVVHWAAALLHEGHVGHRHRFRAWNTKTNEMAVRRINECPSSEYVYDLEMDGHPSFVANGVLVHNSATPVYNYGSEIWTVYNVLDPDLLGSKPEFVKTWCDTHAVNGKSQPVTDPIALCGYLKESGAMLLRTREDVGRELPELQTIVQRCDADLSIIEHAKDKVAELARLLVRGVDLDQQTRFAYEREIDHKLRQATGIAKAPYVAEFVKLIIESGEPKVVVGAWHHAVYDILVQKLADLRPVRYTGEESATQKDESRRRFIEDPACHVMLMSLRSGAGLDGLQAVCTTSVHAELDWSPRVHEQFTGRTHRDGQARGCKAYVLVADDGSDPVISSVLGLKEIQSVGVLGREAAVYKADESAAAVRKLAEAVLRDRR